MKLTTPQLDKLIAETHSNAINVAAGKSKTAVWFVSACTSMSNRNEYINRLKLFINVDVFGDCGTMKCPRSDTDSCRKMAENDYKFYLSLENSLCVDYVTEKFFGPMNFNIIPIVFDLHGHHEKLAPPHSYINAARFPSVRHLADYLNLLDKNDTLYNEYFWWKKHYVIRNINVEAALRAANAAENDIKIRKGAVEKLAMCQLCQRLHLEQPSGRQQKIYHNMTDWWDIQANCQTIRFTTESALNNDEPHYWKAKPHLDKFFG